MLKLSLLVRLEAKPGKENEVADFLQQGLQLREPGGHDTAPVRAAIGPDHVRHLDAFENEAGRQTHLNGPIAKALMDNAPRLLATPPVIERVEVLGAKLPVEALR
jgi:quinol monooxygenase YgiN